jgi:hypothetical protein
MNLITFSSQPRLALTHIHAVGSKRLHFTCWDMLQQHFPKEAPEFSIFVEMNSFRVRALPNLSWLYKKSGDATSLNLSGWTFWLQFL